jgi:hypothetical protein
MQKNYGDNFFYLQQTGRGMDESDDLTPIHLPPAFCYRPHFPACTGSKGVFTSHANPKYFLFHSSHQIFGRMHRVLNVDKKDN